MSCKEKACPLSLMCRSNVLDDQNVLSWCKQYNKIEAIYVHDANSYTWLAMRGQPGVEEVLLRVAERMPRGCPRAFVHCDHCAGRLEPSRSGGCWLHFHCGKGPD
jgi:hypothetical protein